VSDFPCCDSNEHDYTTPEAAETDPQRVQLIDVADHAMVVIVGKDNRSQVVLNCTVAQAASYLEHLAVSMLERSILGELKPSKETQP
jgi:hypothetical protein